MQQPQIQSLYNAFEDNTLKIELSFKRANQNEHHIKAFFSNKSMGPITQVSLQVAVQKYMRLQLQGISSGDIAANSAQQVTQDMKIVNDQEGQKPLALKVRVAYTVNGQAVVETKVLNQLPTNY